MALTVFKNGKRIDAWSTTPANLEFNERAEKEKDPSLYNVQKEKRGLSE